MPRCRLSRVQPPGNAQPGPDAPLRGRQEPRTLGQVPGALDPRAPRPRGQPPLAARGSRPKKLAFADELPAQALRGTKKPVGAVPGGHVPSPHPVVPDYELKYPAVSSERARSCYVAVFQDQYSEFWELQREVGAARAKLGQLEALLSSLPPPRSQEEARVAARVWREFEKKRADPGFLDKQARCRYLKGKLRHLKRQIQKFDNRGDSEGSVYF